MLHRTDIPRSNYAALSVCATALAAALMVSIPTCAAAGAAETGDAKPMPSGSMDHSKMNGMQDMDCGKHMDGMIKTGDSDHDFAANMRTHHQMAVDMSEAELKSGKDPQLLQMSKDIIAAQKKEIAVLDQWLEARKNR